MSSARQETIPFEPGRLDCASAVSHRSAAPDRSLISAAVQRALACLAIASGLLFLTACHREHGTVLGKAPTGQIRNILAVRAGDTPTNVTLQGVIVEKCPVAGCWFYLQDDTGIIKVDTKAAGFVVVDVPLQTKMTVSGKISSDGDEVILEGTGVRF
jgi:uncharacterized protein YdeI (BOF family)